MKKSSLELIQGCLVELELLMRGEVLLSVELPTESDLERADRWLLR